MLKDTILLSSMIKFLVINSTLIIDHTNPCIYRILPYPTAKQQKRSKRLTDAMENQDPEEIEEHEGNIITCI